MRSSPWGSISHLLERCIAQLPPQMVIHRLTGDGAKRDLIAPLWSGDKKRVLNAIHRAFQQDGLVQGSDYVPSLRANGEIAGKIELEKRRAPNARRRRFFSSRRRHPQRFGPSIIRRGYRPQVQRTQIQTAAQHTGQLVKFPIQMLLVLLLVHASG